MWIASEFKPQFELAAKSWAKVERDIRNQHFFATLDFGVAPDTFRRVSSCSCGGWKLETNFGFFIQLGLASAPVVYMYPAAKGPHRPANGKIEPKEYDFNT
jgi:oligosaccharyltransferase complex subunit gamma